jgi:hypothetical protein
MHGRTEDLLSLRDGEPLDAKEREAIDASPALRLEVERLRRVQRALEALPELAPPPGVWERAISATDAPRRAPRHAWAYLGVAAAIAAVAIGYLAVQTESPAILPQAVIATRATSGEAVPFIVLLEESAALEQMLAQMPRRPMMAGSTAATIAGLEDRIAFIDGQLAYASTVGARQPIQQALWSERVDLMSALVHVRYASAQQIVVER